MAAQARKRRPAATSHRHAGIPNWGMLIIGLVIGLFIAFLVYLDKLGNTQVAAPPEPTPAKHQPRFEFYSILPEMEVVVPDGFKKPAASPANTGNTNTPTTPATSKETYFLQAGSFKNLSEADRMKASLSLLGLSVVIQSVAVNNVTWHRVRVGPITNARELDSARQRLIDNNIDFVMLKLNG